MTSATVFALSGNRLTGSLPPGIASLHFLQELLLGRNHLSGNLNAIFNATAQTSLTTIQLNNNQFTGILPTEVFRLPQLLTFAAVSNCFHGQLPDNLCRARTLRSLILDGFGTASTCRNEFLPGVSSSYTLRHTLGQPLPACLLQMPNITALHLSGTGLTGSLPADVTLSSTL
jgi:Leucine-rich repeat (LRR) protein